MELNAVTVRSGATGFVNIAMSKEKYLRLSNCDDPWLCCKCVMPPLSDSLVEECGRASPMTNKEHLHFKTTVFTDDDEGLDHQGECEKLAV